MNSISEFLLKVEPFSKLPVDEVERLSLLSQTVHHTKGEVVYNEGEAASSVWLLQAGQMQIFKYNPDGRPLAIESIQPKQLFGTLCRLGVADAIYPCTAIASQDSLSARIPDRYFQGLYNRFPAMVSSACQLCSQRLGWMQNNVATHQEPVKQRIVRVLFQLQQKGSNELIYTKREISELAATTVETTIRVLSDFKKKRWISSERGKLTLKDLPRLRDVLAVA